MTTQQAFDRVVAHLAQQQRRCHRNGSCLYRGPEGMKCAIGALISDAAVEHIIVANSMASTVTADGVWNAVKEELALEDMPTPRAMMFYRSLQRAHDGAMDLKRLKARLKGAAEEYDLNDRSVRSIKKWSRDVAPDLSVGNTKG